MGTRYSKLSYAPFSLESPPSSNAETFWKTEDTMLIQKQSLMKWINTVWTLAIHFILSVGVAIFVLNYVQGRHFNLTERTPLVYVISGTRVSPFYPTQSDIVTLLSSIIAILRYALAAWAGSLSWYIALFLMERNGLDRRDLRALLNHGLLSPSAYSRDFSTWLIGALLLTSLVASLSSPILTGSISWVPSNELARGLSLDPISFVSIGDGIINELHPAYRSRYAVQEAYAIDGAGGVSIEWGREIDKGAVKRVSHEVWSLSINSTIENITLPYFQVDSIRWIKNRDEIPGIRDGATPTSLLRTYFETTPVNVSGFPVGYAILVPNITTNWSSDPLESTIIHDTRLLILYFGYDDPNEPSGVYMMTKDLPSDAYKLSYDPFYYAFAWVTFSAGVGQCKQYNCQVLSPSTIQNLTSIELEPHQFTFQALSMASVVGVYMVIQNNSLPYLWGNINEYVEAVLIRSYSGAWCQLHKGMVPSRANASYVPSLPRLLARVDQRRVYIWLGLQLLATLLSVLYLIIQCYLSENPLMGDTSLTAFDLDTTAAQTNDADPSVNRARKVELHGARLKVKMSEVEYVGVGTSCNA
ncbi:hypothetical protein B0J17DRAFT_723831 [Rhizoctonia solani]|nr:hypothetical protein B0J17DRAFT_723831 [Rhizoctonia solani]